MQKLHYLVMISRFEMRTPWYSFIAKNSWMLVYLKEIHQFRSVEADGSHTKGISYMRSLTPTFQDTCFWECTLRVTSAIGFSLKPLHELVKGVNKFKTNRFRSLTSQGTDTALGVAAHSGPGREPETQTTWDLRDRAARAPSTCETFCVLHLSSCSWDRWTEPVSGKAL